MTVRAVVSSDGSQAIGGASVAGVSVSTAKGEAPKGPPPRQRVLGEIYDGPRRTPDGGLGELGTVASRRTGRRPDRAEVRIAAHPFPCKAARIQRQ